MLTISGLLNNFRQLDTDKVIEESFVETKGDIERINKEQLKAGKTNTGAKIAPRYRNNKYARLKAGMNPLPGPGVPDLLLTGEFHRQIDVEVSKTALDIISKDEKGPELEEKYPDIFGLGTNFKQQYIDQNLQPTILRKISSIVGLKFGT